MQPLLTPDLSLVVPIYGNESSIDELLSAIQAIQARIDGRFEAVFVVDGSPDLSYSLLRERLPHAGFPAQLVCLSRNFGAFPAIRVGLGCARGQVIAVMAADLQEPPELAITFLAVLGQGDIDVAFGVREGRKDPVLSRLASGLFWSVYRRFVMPDIPKGGVDIFAVTHGFRDRLLGLHESNTSLLAQLFWLGGRRAFVPYQRSERRHGRSGWTLRKKLRYLSDSVFAFTDLPVRILMALGLVSLAIAVLLTIITLVAKFSGLVAVPGYAGTMLVILFFGAFNALGLGVVGSYAWRAFENTKSRPLAVVQSEESFNQGSPDEKSHNEKSHSEKSPNEHMQ
ncbi:MAG: glycosyltransferase family 2 protein [Thermomonas sp.]